MTKKTVRRKSSIQGAQQWATEEDTPVPGPQSLESLGFISRLTASPLTGS